MDFACCSGGANRSGLVAVTVVAAGGRCCCLSFGEADGSDETGPQGRASVWCADGFGGVNNDPLSAVTRSRACSCGLAATSSAALCRIVPYCVLERQGRLVRPTVAS